MTETIVYIQITLDEYLKTLEEAKKQRKVRRSENRMFTAKEISIDCHGLNFYCVYGTYINGGYLAILNWGVSAELSSHNGSVGYNRDKLLAALKHSPSRFWLPKGKELDDLVYNLSEVITKRIIEMKGCV